MASTARGLAPPSGSGRPPTLASTGPRTWSCIRRSRTTLSAIDSRLNHDRADVGSLARRRSTPGISLRRRPASDRPYTAAVQRAAHPPDPPQRAKHTQEGCPMFITRHLRRPAQLLAIACVLLVPAGAAYAAADPLLAPERYYMSFAPADEPQRPAAQEQYYSSYGDPKPLTAPQSPSLSRKTPWIAIALSIAGALADRRYERDPAATHSRPAPASRPHAGVAGPND